MMAAGNRMSAAEETLWNYFSHHVCDLASSQMPGDVRLLFIPHCDDRDVIKQCYEILSPSERRHVQTMGFERGRNQFAIRRAFRRHCGLVALEHDQPGRAISFTETDSGKPLLTDHPDLNFSFSSCARGFVGAWSKDYRLGIDIEDPTRTVEPVALAKRYFSLPEAEFIQSAECVAQRHAFFKLWTLKEAALKSVGKGLAYGLEKFSFVLEPKLRVVNAPIAFGGAEQFHPIVIADVHWIAALVYYDGLRSQ